MKIEVADVGGPVHYADFGGSGPVMVLVHGLGGSHLNWMAVGPELARRHRVLAPDLVGFGYTPPAGRSSRVEENLEVLDRFLASAVREPAILVGNSMGGLLSGFLAARRPDRVRALVLVDPACPNPRFAGVSGLVLAFFGTLLAPGATLYFRRRAQRIGPERLVQATLRAVCADPRRISSELVRAHVELTRLRLHTMPWSEAALVEAGRSLLRVLWRRARYYDTMRAVGVPTLLIEGGQDRLVPPAAVERLASVRPDWEFRVLDGVGHVPMMEAPEEFLAVLESWLGGVESERAG